MFIPGLTFMAIFMIKILHNILVRLAIFSFLMSSSSTLILLQNEKKETWRRKGEVIFIYFLLASYLREFLLYNFLI